MGVILLYDQMILVTQQNDICFMNTRQHENTLWRRML